MAYRIMEALHVDGLSHIGLKSTDLDRTERFYTDVVGAEVTRRRDDPDRRVWMTVAGVRLEIAEIPTWPALDEDQRRALPALSFLATAEETDRIAEHLRDAGVPHRGPVLKAVGSGVGLYFGDPDGNPLSLSCPEGYPADGLERNSGASWPAEPFGWPAKLAPIAG